ncbi:hypothetical protein F4678DRAFT_348503 [Xylaria arbuscula]|nr:hypothetical protein F4678DRAFT_348503 [Xylaria arbuscula]
MRRWIRKEGERAWAAIAICTIPTASFARTCCVCINVTNQRLMNSIKFENSLNASFSSVSAGKHGCHRAVNHVGNETKHPLPTKSTSAWMYIHTTVSFRDISYYAPPVPRLPVCLFKSIS